MILDGGGGKLTNAAAIGAAAGVGAGTMLLVDQEITAVLTVLNAELDELEKEEFETKGHVSTLSFGAGPDSIVLSQHHARAHGVVTTTLTELIADLETFRTAVRDAKTLLVGADEDNKADLLAIVNRTEGLDLGTDALRRAQVEHRHDRPTNEPVAAPVVGGTPGLGGV